MTNRSALDSDFQPAPDFLRGLRIDRGVDELIGLARGYLADGRLCGHEIEDLIRWVETNPDIAGVFPGNVLVHRLNRYCEDGFIDDDELEDLSSTLRGIMGEQLEGGRVAPSPLPLDDPAPMLDFRDRLFCLTGKFALGPRALCEDEVRRRGGSCHNNVTRRVRYVVIGSIGSRDWMHSSFGRKIEKAIVLRERGHGISIVSEEAWAEQL